MKRFLLALTVLCAVQFADAQVKSPAAAKKSLDGAISASQEPKKAAKVATWIKLADAYMDAYNAPAGNVWVGAAKQELQFLMGGEQPTATESVVVNGTPLVKEVYADKDLYFNESGQLAMIVVTNPVVDNALAGAYDAFVKAYEVDKKQSKVKDITAGLQDISQKYLSDAFNSYQLGDMAEASVLFGRAATVSATAPLSKVDTTALYNAGFTAWAVKDYNTALGYFEECLANDYYYDDGEVFAKLSDIYKNLGDAEKSGAILEEGFVKYPQSQSILVGLINYYLENKKSTDRLFELIGLAKQNEPTNASLYYVEGNIYKELGQLDKAVEAYYQCSQINPEYEFGYIGAGVMYYERAIELQEAAANEMDDAKYLVILEDFEKALKNAIVPFEKAFEVTKDNQLKVSIAEYLKNIYYRFYSDGAEYEAGYKKYDAIVKGE